MEADVFGSSQLSRNLAERIKELECLYTISRIGALHKSDLHTALKSIVEEIPNGWQFPDCMSVYLEYGDQSIGEIPNTSNQQTTYLDINKTLKGKLTVYFHKVPTSVDSPYFLLEEQSLLNHIGHEISTIIEIDVRNKQELLIQEKLKYNDRLNLLGEITAGIAHELNTPLGNIMGFSELLLKDEKDENKRHDLKKVIKSAKHAREIVKKLMFFSCEMPSYYKLASLNKLIEEAADLLKLQLNDKSIKLVMNLAEDLPAIEMDPVQFTQVIFNMILNAIDSMDVGGTLRIITTHVNKDIRLKIIDNGCGMSVDEQKRLFQPFYSAKKDKNGIGLGLAVSHGIVQSHGGRIEVESNPGKGTTFTIVLKKQ